ncbi:MBL fold metallo-hydrolase [Kocuria oceani]|uniref:MBL fold metallo-hydrolase n=1 Tax=Kocuria oceani TaxID=988827 RepID=UPI0040367B3D
MTRWTTAANTHDLGSGTTLVTGPGSNWLILRDGTSYTLIDCGYPGDRDLVEASIDAAGATGLPEAVVVTHAHGDHVGTLDRYIAAGVPVHCAAAEVPNLTGTAREQNGPRESLPRAVTSLGWATWCLHALRAGGLKDVTVEGTALTPFDQATEVLDLPGSPRPVATSGHTSGHTAYLVGDTGILAAGDAVVTGHRTTTGSGVPHLLPKPFHHDLDDAGTAARALLSGVDFDVLAPGHGPHVRVPTGRRLAIDRHVRARTAGRRGAAGGPRR